MDEKNVKLKRWLGREWKDGLGKKRTDTTERKSHEFCRRLSHFQEKVKALWKMNY